MRLLTVAAVVAALAFSPAAADDDRPPPPNATPLSLILAQIDAQPDFHYFEEIEWDDGRYEIEYKTRDGREREIKVDPTGQARR